MRLLVYPVERIRRFVTPIDLAGDGRVTTWSTTDSTGADRLGPRQLLPVLPAAGAPLAWNTNANDPANTPATSHLITARTTAPVVTGAPAAPDLTNNALSRV